MPYFNAGTGLSLDDIFDVINVDIENNRVGINNDEPTTDLDVKLIASSNINAFNLLTSNINAYNIQNSNQLITLDLNTLKDVKINGYSLQQPFPNIDWTTIIPGYTGNGYIDPSWIKTQDGGSSFGDLSDILSLVALGTAGLAGIASVASFIAAMGASSLAEALAKKLGDLFDPPDTPEGDDGEGSSNDIQVKWAKIRNKPIATNLNTFGVDRDVYFANNKFIKLVDSANFTTTENNNKILDSTAGAINFIDLSNRKIYANQLHIGNDSNLTINSNNITFNTPGTIIANKGVFSINSNSLAFGKITSGSSVEPTYSLSENGLFLFKTTQSIYFNNNATIIGSNCLISFNSNTFSYGSIDNSNVVSPIFGVSGGVLTLHRQARILGPDEQFRNSNNYARLDYSLSNGLKWGIGFTSSNINDIFTINSNGNITTIGNTMTFSNTATIQADLKGTQFLNGKSYDAKGLINMEFNRFTYGQALVDQQFSNIPSSNFVSPVLSVNRDEGISMYGRTCLLGSNETLVLPNPQLPFSNILLSNYGRLEYSLSSGLVYGSGYSNNILNNEYDIFKVQNDGSVYTLNQDNYTMTRLVNNRGDIIKGHTTIKNNGDMTCSNLTISGNLFIGDDVRLSRLGMYLYGKKMIDFILQRLFSRYIEFDGVFDNPGFNPNFRQDYPDYFAL